MNYYCAIRRKKDNRFVSGTDYRYHPPHQIFADETRPPLLIPQNSLETEIAVRHINLKHYETIFVFLCEVRKFSKFEKAVKK